MDEQVNGNTEIISCPLSTQATLQISTIKSNNLNHELLNNNNNTNISKSNKETTSSTAASSSSSSSSDTTTNTNTNLTPSDTKNETKPSLTEEMSASSTLASSSEIFSAPQVAAAAAPSSPQPPNHANIYFNGTNQLALNMQKQANLLGANHVDTSYLKSETSVGLNSQAEKHFTNGISSSEKLSELNSDLSTSSSESYQTVNDHNSSPAKVNGSEVCV